LLNVLGYENIQKNGILLRDGLGTVQSSISVLSTHTGLYSNLNIYTLCDLYKMKDATFFTEIDGSTRGVPNAMGLIDSTVSHSEHILYTLYNAWQNNLDPTLYFSYRYSEHGIAADYWNPNTTDAQLDGYRVKFPFGDFDRFFRNVWDAGKESIFSPEMLSAIRYLGVDKQVNVHDSLIEVIKEERDFLREKDKEAKNERYLYSLNNKIADVERRLWKVESVYPLVSGHNTAIFPEVESLNTLSDLYDTNWAILAGLDCADATEGKRTAARTIVSFIAKGLAGSRKNPFMAINNLQDKKEGMEKGALITSPPYIYFLMYLLNIEDHSTEGMKGALEMIHEYFDGIDIIGSERYRAWDLAPWCEDRDVQLSLWQSTYNLQRAIFGELYNSIKFGRFKAPRLAVIGSTGKLDILEEELGVFSHVPATPPKTGGWFGSPQKLKKDGIQDDAVFAIGNAIYAGRELSPLDFKERKGSVDFGSFFADKNLLGRY